MSEDVPRKGELFRVLQAYCLAEEGTVIASTASRGALLTACELMLMRNEQIDPVFFRALGFLKAQLGPRYNTILNEELTRSVKGMK